tara:strand:- start:422 stop:538 length:117 start_codon:yes stop_codon:yes gene_type:complete
MEAVEELPQALEMKLMEQAPTPMGLAVAVPELEILTVA